MTAYGSYLPLNAKWEPPTNATRAEWGEAAVKTDPDYGKNDVADTVGDVLANIMHYCDREKIDFHKCFGFALMNYSAEVEGES